MINVIFAAVFLSFTSGCQAQESGAGWIDKQALSEHIRESYEFPAELELRLGDPKPSPIKGFNELEMTLSAGSATQSEKVFVSDDGRHYILGGFKDLKVHPDQERLRKVDISGSAYRGAKDAPVQVVEYTDFQCAFCRRGFWIMRDEIMKAFPGKVRWVYKSMPLVRIHPWAKPAAIAAECAKRQSYKKLWALHDVFFEKQREITRANFEDKLQDFVKETKLDADKFNACYDKKATLAFVDKDMAEARALGISGTPAFVINGHLIPGAAGRSIRRVIEEALRGKHGKI